MNGHEQALLRRLADADAQLPPPACEHAFTPERLAALVAGRQRRRWRSAAAAFTVAAASLTLWLLPAWPQAAGTAATDLDRCEATQLQRLTADLERLRQRVASLPDLGSPPAASSPQQLAARLRFELATARADALTHLPTPRPPEFR